MSLRLSDLETDLPTVAPPITAIANMPFPQSMLTMRRFYNHQWHKPEADGETVGKWRVEIEFTYRDRDFFTAEVEALTEDEAKKLGEDAFDKAHRWTEDCSIIGCAAEFQADAA